MPARPGTAAARPSAVLRSAGRDRIPAVGEVAGWSRRAPSCSPAVDAALSGAYCDLSHALSLGGDSGQEGPLMAESTDDAVAVYQLSYSSHSRIPRPDRPTELAAIFRRPIEQQGRRDHRRTVDH